MVMDTEVDYKCSLSKETQAIALKELREDENVRSQALKQFRDWILKHPSIRRCRTDPQFLLRFLRTKKFSLPMAQEMLERYLSAKQLCPEWFQNLDINDPDIEALIDCGYTVPLLKRDQYGRQVILNWSSRANPYRFGSRELNRAHSIVSELLLDTEENQVRGYTYVQILTGATMAHGAAWSLTDIRNAFRWVQEASPLRFKQVHIVSCPSPIRYIMDFMISFLNKKFKDRVTFHKDIDDLKQTIDPKILPKELGGDVPLADIIAIFKEKLHQKREEILALDKMYIEVSVEYRCSLSSDGFGGISGSFRKLEVD